MKYLVLLLVIVGVLWFARAGRRPKRGAEPGPPPAARPVVSCTHCGVHLPRDEAISGAQGPYCSEAHRLAHGDRR